MIVRDFFLIFFYTSFRIHPPTVDRLGACTKKDHHGMNGSETELPDGTKIVLYEHAETPRFLAGLVGGWVMIN